MGGYVAGLGALSWASEAIAKERHAELEARSKARGKTADLHQAACEKVRAGAPVTREELAAYLVVSTRKIQRMEAAGILTRCPGLGTVVRYFVSDDLRLASAKGKER